MFTQIMLLRKLPKFVVSTKKHAHQEEDPVKEPSSPVAPSQRRVERVKLLQQAYLQHPTVEAAMKAGDYEMAYDLIAPKLDPNGFRRFWMAEEYTGIDVHTYFYIEDSLCRFEAANGNQLLEWLESAAFGSQEWTVLQDGVEVSTARIINKACEEYKTYRVALHKSTVMKLLGLPEDQ